MGSKIPLVDLDVLVVGCGIAGLTTAVACREKGFNVRVLESSAEFSHVSCDQSTDLLP
jgi:salicylate hydroxylase